MSGGEALRYLGRGGGDSGDRTAPIAYDWFRQFLQYMLDNGWYTWFAKLVVWGELLVGLALLLGALVGLSAFIGTFMNFNYMLAGSASTNPVLFGLAFSCSPGKWVGTGTRSLAAAALGTPWARAEAQVDQIADRAEREAVA